MRMTGWDGNGNGMGNGNWKRNGNRNGNGDNNDLFITFFVLFCTISPWGMCSIYVYPVSAVDVYVTIEKIPLRKLNTNLSDCSLIVKDLIAWWGSAPLSSRKHWQISPFTAGVKRGALATLLQFH
jgi:hypothetical protein